LNIRRYNSSLTYSELENRTGDKWHVVGDKWHVVGDKFVKCNFTVLVQNSKPSKILPTENFEKKNFVVFWFDFLYKKVLFFLVGSKKLRVGGDKSHGGGDKTCQVQLTCLPQLIFFYQMIDYDASSIIV
jgi:hypothetical protein